MVLASGKNPESLIDKKRNHFSHLSTTPKNIETLTNRFQIGYLHTVYDTLERNAYIKSFFNKLKEEV